jgi:hypothetical protein
MVVFVASFADQLAGDGRSHFVGKLVEKFYLRDHGNVFIF